MAHATLNADKVWNAVQLALEDVDRNMVLGGTHLVTRRARIAALGDLARAAAGEDAAHAHVTVTEEEFALVAGRYGQAIRPALKAVAV